MTRELALRWPLLPKFGWGPLRLGMSRSDAIRAIEGHDCEVDPDDLADPDPTYLEMVAPWGVLHFDEKRDELVQIEVLDEHLCVGEECFSEPTLDLLLTALGVRSFNDARWTHKTLKQPLPDDADRELLRGGALWIVSLGLGLELSDGRVDSLILQQPGAPIRGDLGPLTPQQLELATSPEVLDPQPSPIKKRPLYRLAMRVALVLLVAALGMELYRGYRSAMRWRSALPANGIILRGLPEGKEPPARYLVAFSPEPATEYQVEIASQEAAGQLKAGEKIDLVYQPHAPRQATTQFAASRTGFQDHVPNLLAIGAVYCAVVAILSVLLR